MIKSRTDQRPTPMRWRQGRHRVRMLVGAAALATPALSVSGCAQPQAAPATTSPGATTNADTSAPQPTYRDLNPPDDVVLALSGGRGQATVTGAQPGAVVQLSSDNTIVAQATADANGAVVFRNLIGSALPSAGATVRAQSRNGRSDVAQVVAADTPAPDAHYREQRLPTTNTNDGRLGYIKTFDGTTLSASVWLPGPVEDGPYPTVIEYSGYTPSDPNSVGFAQLFTGLGYAYVGVNMRGTGCSGGSFEYFEFQQSMDGYDVVETVAAQPWVLHNKVGMVGVSYPGISQLFVAKTQPPSLAAITPLSVIADSYESTLYPGGVLNTGFAVDWLKERMDQARPNGQRWAEDRIAAGDNECGANQRVRLQAPDQLSLLRSQPFWNADSYAELSPRLFADEITVPTFMAGAWQDEQTGSDFANLIGRFADNDDFYATLLNGLHTESISPAVVPRLVEFLDLFVAQRTPTLASARQLVKLIGASIFGTDDLGLPDSDRFADKTPAEALAEFRAEAPIEVLFEQGAADGHQPGTPMARFSAGFDTFPVPDAKTTTWYLSGDGGTDAGILSATPGQGATTQYRADPDATPPVFFSGDGNIWAPNPSWKWLQGPRNTYASWLSAPLEQTTTVLGTGSVDIWLTATKPDTDIEVTLSEVRPDGNEVYVQSGWLRASHRALDPQRSTPVRPVPTNTEADASPLPAVTPVAVRVSLLPMGHVFRAGSQIRLTVDAPGGNRAQWEFDTVSSGETVTIVTDSDRRAALVLPTVDLAARGVDVPTERPACGALRGQPCRPFATS